MAPFRRVNLQVYLEGIQVDFHSIRIDIQANMPAQAEIALVPVPGFLSLRPRTLVHVFYEDPDFSNQPDGDRFKLLFEGEVLGIRLQRTEASRNIVLNCADLSNYWTSMKAYFLPGAAEPFMWNRDVANFVGLNSPDLYYITPLGIPTFDKLASDIYQYNNHFPYVFTRIFQAARDNNPFWKIQDRRRKISDRVTAVPDLEGEELFNKFISQHLLLFKSMITQESRETSIYEVMSRMMQIAFYRFVSIPTAPISRYELSSDRFKDVNPVRSIGSFILKPDTFLTAPPTCNILFPDQISAFSSERNFLSEPTRISVSSPMFVNGANGNRSDPLVAYFHAPETVWRRTQIKAGSRVYDVFDDTVGNNEWETGIIHKKVPFEYSAFIRPGNASEPHSIIDPSSPANQYMRAVTKYLFSREKLQQRPVRVTCAGFNPYVVCDFPALYMDPSGPIFFDVEAISHAITARGQAVTSIAGSCSRSARSEAGHENELPFWLNKAYWPDYAGLDSFGDNRVGAHRALLGCDNLISLMDLVDSSGNRVNFNSFLGGDTIDRGAEYRNYLTKVGKKILPVGSLPASDPTDQNFGAELKFQDALNELAFVLEESGAANNSRSFDMGSIQYFAAAILEKAFSAVKKVGSIAAVEEFQQRISRRGVVTKDLVMLGEGPYFHENRKILVPGLGAYKVEGSLRGDVPGATLRVDYLNDPPAIERGASPGTAIRTLSPADAASIVGSAEAWRVENDPMRLASIRPVSALSAAFLEGLSEDDRVVLAEPMLGSFREIASYVKTHTGETPQILVSSITTKANLKSLFDQYEAVMIGKAVANSKDPDIQAGIQLLKTLVPLMFKPFVPEYQEFVLGIRNDVMGRLGVYSEEAVDNLKDIVNLQSEKNRTTKEVAAYDREIEQKQRAERK